jgi:tRNA A-37 threonylcarbamoyl transferase component Bud32
MSSFANIKGFNMGAKKYKIMMGHSNMHKCDVIVKEGKSKRFEEAIDNEYKIMKYAHDNGIFTPEILEYNILPDGTRQLIMRYYSNSKLNNGTIQRLSLKKRIEVIKKLIAEVNKLHKLGITHNDLNLGNYLLVDDNIMLIDFGASIFSDDRSEDISKLSTEIIGILTDKYPSNRTKLNNSVLDEIKELFSSIQINSSSINTNLKNMTTNNRNRKIVSLNTIMNKPWFKS